MAQAFIITGLPRSRTAWLAAACNTIPEAICWHEPMAWCADWASLQRLLNTSLYQYAGISDSLAGFRLSDLARETKARVLIVARDKEDVRRSLDRLFHGINASEMLEELGNRLGIKGGCGILEYRAYWIDYEELSNTRLVCAALRFLMPEATICHEKIAELQRLNVQADMDRVKREAVGQGDRVRGLMGGVAEVLG